MRGLRHDKRALEKQQVVVSMPPEVSILADSGFQGVRHPKLCVPDKSTKNQPLSEEQREWKRLLASARVVVEQSIAGMKRYNALAGIYRNRLPKTDDPFNVLAAGLWNYAKN